MDGERELRGSAAAKSSGHCHHLSTPCLSSVWLLLHSSRPHPQEQSTKGFAAPKTCWNNLQIQGLLFTGAWSLNVSYHLQDPIKCLTPLNLILQMLVISVYAHFNFNGVLYHIWWGWWYQQSRDTIFSFFVRYTLPPSSRSPMHRFQTWTEKWYKWW